MDKIFKLKIFPVLFLIVIVVLNNNALAKKKFKNKPTSFSKPYRCLADLNNCSKYGATKNGSIPDYVMKSLEVILENSTKYSINPRAINQAVQFYTSNYDNICNKKFITIVDYNKPQLKDRLTIINLEDQTIESIKVANGTNTDPDHDGKANRFSNNDGDSTSSIGFYLTGKEYIGTKGQSMGLQGLSDNYNSNACSRDIVLHGDNYPNSKYKVAQGGRSNGCLALTQSDVDSTIQKIQNGSLLYSYHETLASAYPVFKNESLAFDQPNLRIGLK